MDWFSSAPWLAAFGFGVLVLVGIAAWVIYILVEVLRAASQSNRFSGVMQILRATRRLADWAPRPGGRPFTGPLSQRLLFRRPAVSWLRGPTSRPSTPNEARTLGGNGTTINVLERGSLVLYVGPDYWPCISAWVVDVHPDNSCDLEWLHPWEGRMVRAPNVRPERDKAHGLGYWKEHPTSIMKS